ncbi:MAG: VOC family protein [Proteobacteria bacterium]|nr:VOC family protein [Pseudomonadota bacterium]
MKYGYTILYVEDVLKTVSFYEKAFGLKTRFVHDSNAYAEMETGQTRLAFTSKALAKENGLDFGQLGASFAPAPFEVALVTDKVEAAFTNAVENGAISLKNPVQKPWGQLVGYVKDCNGFLVEICSPLD